jgi:excisionase family DNA binding protein
VSTQLGGLVARPLLVHHVAKRLGLSRRMIRYLARRGTLRAHKAGPKIWQFLAADVDEFRMRREVRHA